MIQDALDRGILDAQHHRKLIQTIEHYAELAGIQPHAICSALSESCGDDSAEYDWVMEYLMNRQSPPSGIAYVGRWDDLDERMSGLAGCMIRNFIDARVMTVEYIVEHRPEVQMVLVPNFLTTIKWKQEILEDWLTERLMTGKPTVIHVPTIRDLSARARELKVFSR